MMLDAVLRMPPDLWSGDPLDVQQRHARYIEAATLIDSLTNGREQPQALEDLVAECKRIFAQGIDGERAKALFDEGCGAIDRLANAAHAVQADHLRSLAARNDLLDELEDARLEIMPLNSTVAGALGDAIDWILGEPDESIEAATDLDADAAERDIDVRASFDLPYLSDDKVEKIKARLEALLANARAQGRRRWRDA